MKYRYEMINYVEQAFLNCLRNKYVYKIMSIFKKIYFFDTCKEIVRSPFAYDLLEEALQRFWMFHVVSVMQINSFIILKIVGKKIVQEKNGVINDIFTYCTVETKFL